MTERVLDGYIDVTFDGCNCVWHGPHLKLVEARCPLHLAPVKTVTNGWGEIYCVVNQILPGMTLDEVMVTYYANQDE